MHEKDLQEYASILAFDVRVDNDAAVIARELKVKIFTAVIINHHFDITAYPRGLVETRRAAADAIAVYPCVLKILIQHRCCKRNILS